MAVRPWTWRFRGVLVSPPLIFALVCFRWETEVEWLIWPPATILILGGALLRLWAQEHLHKRLHKRLKVPRHLATTGPYAFVRNPLYIGNTLICMGATAASELLWLIPITFVWCIMVYSLAIQYEERRLLERYGASYLKYMAEVPRWFPRMRRTGNIELVNQFFLPSLRVEFQNVLILPLFALKEWIDCLYFK